MRGHVTRAAEGGGGGVAISSMCMSAFKAVAARQGQGAAGGARHVRGHAGQAGAADV